MTVCRNSSTKCVNGILPRVFGSRYCISITFGIEIQARVGAIVISIHVFPARQISGNFKPSVFHQAGFADMPRTNQVKEILHLVRQCHFSLPDRTHAFSRRDPCGSIGRKCYISNFIAGQPSQAMPQGKTLAVVSYQPLCRANPDASVRANVGGSDVGRRESVTWREETERVCHRGPDQLPPAIRPRRHHKHQRRSRADCG